MREVMVFAGRNMKRYFRNVGVMLFSFLSVFIVVSLYMFILTDMQIESIMAITGDVEGVENMIVAWVVGGLMCIPAISVPILVLCFKVDDVVDGVMDDLFITPMKRIKIMLGYVFAAWLVGFIMSLLTFALCEIFIGMNGGTLLQLRDMMTVIVIISLVIVSFSGLSFFIILFLKSNAAVSVVISVLNTLLGFLLGLFVPIGMLSDGIASVIKAFPALQAAAWLRAIFMRDALEKLTQTMGASAVNQIKEMYGVDIMLGEHLLSTSDIIMILIVMGIVCFGACSLVIGRTKRK